jgi:uncharacterized membrane protein YphA (DoxX/SURF4 family)
MHSKTKSFAYWTTTVLISMETLAGGMTDLARGRAMIFSGPQVAGIVTHLGYPVYLLAILGFWKVLGGIVLLAPRLPRLKEWAYAGIVFELTGAAASWVLHGDNARELASPLSLAALAVASWALRPPDRILGALFPARAPA